MRHTISPLPFGYFANSRLRFLQNNMESMSSELAILDTKDFSKTVALVKLPVRLRAGIHGNWVDDRDIKGWPMKFNWNGRAMNGSATNGHA